MTKLIKIGNSQGVRIPKELIELANLKGEIEFVVKDGGLLLRPASPRKGWDKAFLKAKENALKNGINDDELNGWLDGELVSDE
ncbi:AbrB/MazE/SpoVT family DNA-binding domain-containing protein [Campylobacter ureolyticus]|uniref:AbrB/MazE/SpoVT family DNA-binding domain-containing protein n=1 Tax=Campylobacter ureolyticus TaxID=827 RepID=A0A9Q4KTC2_9BACT|nr:AbrB/MazE/SpoVT family DNA-binding domain-containing protein [Campylobacter ureolyticus]MCZ6104060.1 AbrB/MazE/SpoVT family DNA-binding domain-containing protein [Campylobacter ureolyticus]MCZ6135483.1 AbrB/MazE/SpoVT family DNA-binding domain-containing protein [Campylobacter ureolyticus]MCZ6162439.1 AbrB/MazE/SpoVT family DNA-binding domain-containing protein [Campylobacter ureolyticus]MCZ6171364.1 AbrB/MazE/SpoVT family DNA-binding domain-containing protein [Campylobacter ureolyticus]MDU